MRTSFLLLGAVLVLCGALTILCRRFIVRALNWAFRRDGSTRLLIDPHPRDFILPGIAIIAAGLLAAWYALPH